MRLLILSKWTTGVDKCLFNIARIEHKSFGSRVGNHSAHCCNMRCYSTTLVSNPNNNNTCLVNRYNVNTRSFSITSALAKSKDKEKKSKGGKPQRVDRNELGQFIDIDKFIAHLEKPIVDLKNNYTKHLTLRSTTGSIEQVPITFDGQDYELQELVQISRKAKTVVLNVASFPQAIPQILDALSKSGMNLNPQQDGTTIFIPIPKVTKEHRENLSKNAKALFIKCRDSIKDVRNKEIKSLKKIPSISEDDCRRIQTQIETFGDQYIHEAEQILETKQKELIGSSD